MDASVTEPERLEVRTPDRRRLDVLVAGRDGTPLVFHHGTPGSNLPFRPWVGATLARGLRLVTYSRPGYGGSDRAEGRSVGDCAADVASILDALDAERCVTVGASGGGPHALAVAALLPDRTLACASVASVGMFGVDGLDFLAGMGEDNIVEFDLAARGDGAGLTRFMDDHVEATAGSSPEALIGSLRSLLSPVDVEALTGELGTHWVESSHEAFRNGIGGWFDDDLAFTRPWGFDLATISVPVAVWQGGQDLMVPPAHAHWLAAHIPGARTRFHPEQGHVSLTVGGFGDVIDDALRAADVTTEGDH